MGMLPSAHRHGTLCKSTEEEHGDRGPWLLHCYSDVTRAQPAFGRDTERKPSSQGRRLSLKVVVLSWTWKSLAACTLFSSVVMSAQCYTNWDAPGLLNHWPRLADSILCIAGACGPEGNLPWCLLGLVGTPEPVLFLFFFFPFKVVQHSGSRETAAKTPGPTPLQG